MIKNKLHQSKDDNDVPLQIIYTYLPVTNLPIKIIVGSTNGMPDANSIVQYSENVKPID